MKANLSLFLLLLLCSILFAIGKSYANPRLHWVEKQIDESKKSYLYFDVHEEIGLVEMQVNLIGPNTNGIKADIYAVDGQVYETELPDYGHLVVEGATQTEDYLVRNPFLYWAPGETGPKKVQIKILDDRKFEAEGVEWFNLVIAPHCEGTRTFDQCQCVSACEDHSKSFEIIGSPDRTIWVVDRADAQQKVSSDLNKDGLIDAADHIILKNGWEKSADIDEYYEEFSGLTAFGINWSTSQMLP